MVSVLILTRNEEQDLPGALRSVAWSDDVHVLDSCSTDRTPALARAAGARLHQRPFDDYASQRNHALQLPFKHPWLFLLDADERPTPCLALELQNRAHFAPPELAAFRLRRRDFLFNTWLQHAQLSPFYIRLVRPNRVRYTRAINEQLEVEGSILDLQQYLDHYPFSKGLTHWLTRHNHYSTFEATLIQTQSGLQHPSVRQALTHPDFHQRRLHQKALFYQLPARPILKFAYLYLLRRGFLDGRAGLTYSLLQSIYEYLIVLKTRELRLPPRSPSI